MVKAQQGIPYRKRKKRDFSYYSFHDVLSRNAMFSIVVGARGLGKTYGAKRDAIKNYLRDGSQFIYLRRYRDEMKSKQTFFDDVAEEFPNIGLRVNGDIAQITFEPQLEKSKWHTIGYFRTLSTAQSQKSQAFPLVTRIIFDEFILEKGFQRYLPNEVDALIGFYMTVDRFQDRCRLIMLANSVSIMNPYFLRWNIKPEREFVTVKDGENVFVVCHFADSKDFTTEVLETRLGKFIAGSGYGDYSTGNVFADAHDYLVAKKDSDAQYWFSMTTAEGSFSIWRNYKVHPVTVFVQEKRPKNEIMFVTQPELMTNDTILMFKNDVRFSMLRRWYAHGMVLFDSPKSRNAFIHVFDRRTY